MIKLFVGDNLDKRKLNWVKWKKYMTSKKDVGLEVESLCAFNRVLLIKWKC